MDLLSNLPDDVLCHILSFLTTKEAALTLILCKRWRNLIAFVPNLDFGYSSFLDPEDRGFCILHVFMDFVDRVLALQGNSHIKKFSLDCTGVDTDRVDAWIHNVMVRGVSELELSILSVMKSGDNYRLFQKKFENKKLVKLSVVGHDFNICWLNGAFSYRRSKLSFLTQFTYLLISLKFFVMLCLRLRNVLSSISWKKWGNDADVIVSSASLKTLKIYSIGGVLDTFTFDTPSLVNFGYSDYAAKDYSVAKMENLLEARISLWVSKDEIKRARAPNNDWLQDNVVLRFANVGKLMNGIRNVRYLIICVDTLEVVSLCCESMSVFKNLKSLTIESNWWQAWQAWQSMPALLRNCPHLETLVIGGKHVHRALYFEFMLSGSLAQCHREMRVFLSLRFSRGHPVKVLKIQEFQGTMEELLMIKHFLVYLPCLKEIKIYIKGNGLTQLRVPNVSEAMAEMIEFNKLSNCNVQLLVNGCLYKKWTAQ